jgi:hypothetical protein
LLTQWWQWSNGIGALATKLEKIEQYSNIDKLVIVFIWVSG